MKLLMTGATGVIGRETIPLLVAAGHDVRAVARYPASRQCLRDAGAHPIAVDLFDVHRVRDAVAGADAVLHFATSIPPLGQATKTSAWINNDRLRAEATEVLVDAAMHAGVERFVLESMTFFYADQADRWIDESSPVDASWKPLRSALTAEELLRRHAGAGGHAVALRLAQLYGPGAVSAEYLDALARRRLPLVGAGDNYVSRLHIADAATAIVASLAVPAGTYNVCEDKPAPARASIDQLVRLLDARRPRRLPRWVAGLIAGPGVETLTRSQRVSNRQLRAVSDWSPSYPAAAAGWPEIVAARTRAGDRVDGTRHPTDSVSP